MIDTTFIDKAKLVAEDDAAIVGKGFASMSGNDDVRKSAHLRANDCDAFNYFDKYGHIAYLGAVHSEAITQIMIVDVDSFGGDVDLSEDVQSGADISYLEGALDFEAWLVRIFFHRDRSALQSPFCREHPEYCNYIRRGRLQGVRVIGLKKSGRRLSHARRVSRMAEESDA